MSLSIRLSQTRIREFLRCPRRFYYGSVVGLPVEASRSQRVGQLGHEALALWYLFGDPEQALAPIRQALADPGVPEELELLARVLVEYFEYSREHDDFTVLGTELRIEDELSLDGRTIPVVGILDGLVCRGSKLYVLEHKFNKQFVTTHVDLDPQISLYIMLTERLLGVRPEGVLFNVIKPHKLPLQVRREFAFRPRFSERALLEDLAATARMIEAAETTGWPRNATKDCYWDCPFFSVCLREFWGEELRTLVLEERIDERTLDL